MAFILALVSFACGLLIVFPGWQAYTEEHPRNSDTEVDTSDAANPLAPALLNDWLLKHKEKRRAIEHVRREKL